MSLAESGKWTCRVVYSSIRGLPSVLNATTTIIILSISVLLHNILFLLTDFFLYVEISFREFYIILVCLAISLALLGIIVWLAVKTRRINRRPGSQQCSSDPPPYDTVIVDARYTHSNKTLALLYALLTKEEFDAQDSATDRPARICYSSVSSWRDGQRSGGRVLVKLKFKKCLKMKSYSK